MSLLRMVRIVYLVYTLYVSLLMSSTTLEFCTIVPAVILMWVNYFTFHAGYIMRTNGSTADTEVIRRTWVLSRRRLLLLVIAVLAILSSLVATKFYTGQTPLSLIKNLQADRSVYYMYQSHFREQEIDVFRLSKLPYVLMLFFIKVTFFYSFVSLLMGKERLSFFERAYLALVTSSYLYLGIARGTHIEFFELLIITLFVIFSRRKKAEKFGGKLGSLIKTLVLGWVMGMVYYGGVRARGVSFSHHISRDVRFDAGGLLPYISQSLASIILVFYGYFGFGFYYTSVFITDFWMVSGERFLAGLLPFGFRLMGEPDVRVSMKMLVDMGARWHPDVVLLIDCLGLFGLLAFSFLLGLFARSILRINALHGVVELTQFMILLQMISLPVGNFVWISSSNKLTVLCLVAFWVLKLLTRVRARNSKSLVGR